MFVPPPIHQRLAGLRLALFGRDRRRARQSSERTRARFRLEGLEDRCLLSITEFPTPHSQCRSQAESRRAPTATSGSPRTTPTRSG